MRTEKAYELCRRLFKIAEDIQYMNNKDFGWDDKAVIAAAVRILLQQEDKIKVTTQVRAVTFLDIP